MDTTRSILASVFRNLGIEDRLTLACLQRDWTGLFGEPLSSHTYPSSVNKGKLVVNVDSPLWLQQLKFFRQTMLKKLETYGISSLDFKHGKTHVFTSHRTAGNLPDSNAEGKDLCETDLEWIKQTVDGINDPELRESMKNVLEKALKKDSRQ
jgi:Dna[CI] antecedent, DciA